MKPIVMGHTGRGVEDIQRRLAALDYPLGAGGVDGIFHTDTAEAVKSLQRDYQLLETGEVDTRTWSLLVDSTFAFGDRSLYLRMPHFHGQDVATLQQALNVLGFSCGEIDGIFGPFTERAVADFQSNIDLGSDGVVGTQTVEEILNLKHIWGAKESSGHPHAYVGSLKREKVIEHYRWCFVSTDRLTRQVATRVANLATATCAKADIQCRHNFASTLMGNPNRVTVAFTKSRNDIVGLGTFITYEPNKESLASSLRAHFVAPLVNADDFAIVIDSAYMKQDDNLGFQYMAAVILDSLCMAFE